MNWDEDIDLLAGKKVSAKQGRRASNNENNPNATDTDSTSNTASSPTGVPKAKTGGWAEENSKLKSRGSSSNIFDREKLHTQKSQEIEDDIPVIPDIDDLQDDPLNLPDVNLPTVTVEKSTYKELDNQFEHLQIGQPSFGNLGDIDLSILTSRLYPEKEVQRPNEVWTVESLFQDIREYQTRLGEKANV